MSPIINAIDRLNDTTDKLALISTSSPFLYGDTFTEKSIAGLFHVLNSVQNDINAALESLSLAKNGGAA